MFLGDINVLFLFFFLILGSFVINSNTTLHWLLSAELLWITLYTIVLIVGIVYDNLNILSLTFFFLIFSAIEFSIGLVILLLQHLITRTLGLHTSDGNLVKYTNRYTRYLYLNRINFKI